MLFSFFNQQKFKNSNERTNIRTSALSTNPTTIKSVSYVRFLSLCHVCVNTFTICFINCLKSWTNTQTLLFPYSVQWCILVFLEKLQSSPVRVWVVYTSMSGIHLFGGFASSYKCGNQRTVFLQGVFCLWLHSRVRFYV